MGEKSQAMKKTSEASVCPGTDIYGVQHCSENYLLLKGKGFKGRVGWGSGGKCSPPLLQFWVGLLIQLKDISQLGEKFGTQQRLKSAMASQHSSKNV